MTYTVALAKRLTNETVIEPINGLPLMTIAQARKACEIARANGIDAIVFNTAAQ